MDQPGRIAAMQGDSALFAVLSQSPAGSSEWRAALEVLYRRHFEILFRSCLRYQRRLGGPDEVESLVQDTFLRAAERAATYNAADAITPEQQARNTHKWLRQIAFRLYLDRDGPRKMLLETMATIAEDERVRGLSATAPEAQAACQRERQLAADIARAARALAVLSERDRTILVVSLEWYNRETGEFDVPTDVAQDLCELYELSPGTYRQIRRRALKLAQNCFLSGAVQVA